MSSRASFTMQKRNPFVDDMAKVDLGSEDEEGEDEEDADWLVSDVEEPQDVTPHAVVDLLRDRESDGVARQGGEADDAEAGKDQGEESEAEEDSDAFIEQGTRLNHPILHSDVRPADPCGHEDETSAISRAIKSVTLEIGSSRDVGLWEVGCKVGDRNSPAHC